MSSAAGRIVQIWVDESFVPLQPKVVRSCLQDEQIIGNATQNQRRCAEQCAKQCAKLLVPNLRIDTIQRHSRDAIQVTQFGTALALREAERLFTNACWSHLHHSVAVIRAARPGSSLLRPFSFLCWYAPAALWCA
jgi:hypothetical protein